jgi:hypothetical protein
VLHVGFVLTLYEDTIKMEFPQFRKLENGRSLYKITSPNQFIELQQIGTNWFHYKFDVQQFPDLLRIEDMLQGKHPFEVVQEIEFETIFSQV